ncbi:MAG TPA: SDR family NAD(P)-dependent oxidoreductase [Kofleriaceae bacterium]|nr:SDR family NAD(P)-dependent oxidoreductase [Kofleriaceae bacterium]
MSKIAVVIGAGPGLGAAVVRRFAREGFQVGVVARKRETVEPIAQAVGGRAYAADATDAAQVAKLFAQIREELGAPDVLIYNASAFKMGGILEVSPEEFEDCWKVGCHAAFLCAREVLPAMVERGAGTILLTGATAAVRGSARFSCLAVGKFGLRALGQSIAREFGERGVHVAHVIVDGQIDSPRARAWAPQRPDRSFLAPDAIAETYWHLHMQHPTAWTQELDLRPAVEKF